MDMYIDSASGDYELLACDYFGTRADDERWMDTIHDIRIAGLSKTYNRSILDTNIRLYMNALETVS